MIFAVGLSYSIWTFYVHCMYTICIDCMFLMYFVCWCFPSLSVYACSSKSTFWQECVSKENGCQFFFVSRSTVQMSHKECLTPHWRRRVLYLFPTCCVPSPWLLALGNHSNVITSFCAPSPSLGSLVAGPTLPLSNSPRSPSCTPLHPPMISGVRRHIL